MNVRFFVAPLAIVGASFAAFEACGLSDGGDGPFGATSQDATVEAAPKPDATAEDAPSADAGADVGDDGPGPPDVTTVPCLAMVDGGVDGALGDAIAPFQTFGDPHMFGCSGTVTWPKRNTLCNGDAGCVPCTAAQWLEGFGDAAPRHQYWTDEPLSYFGLELNCRATGSVNGSTCPPDLPFRVCMDGDASAPRASVDSNGNRCLFTRCGFTDAGDGGALDAAPGPNLHFGGCSTGTTAGTLCCCP